MYFSFEFSHVICFIHCGAGSFGHFQWFGMVSKPQYYWRTYRLGFRRTMLVSHSGLLICGMWKTVYSNRIKHQFQNVFFPFELNICICTVEAILEASDDTDKIQYSDIKLHRNLNLLQKIFVCLLFWNL